MAVHHFPLSWLNFNITPSQPTPSSLFQRAMFYEETQVGITVTPNKCNQRLAFHQSCLSSIQMLDLSPLKGTIRTGRIGFRWERNEHRSGHNVSSHVFAFFLARSSLWNGSCGLGGTRLWLLLGGLFRRRTRVQRSVWFDRVSTTRRRHWSFGRGSFGAWTGMGTCQGGPGASRRSRGRSIRSLTKVSQNSVHQTHPDHFSCWDCQFG